MWWGKYILCLCTCAKMMDNANICMLVCLLVPSVVEPNQQCYMEQVDVGAGCATDRAVGKCLQEGGSGLPLLFVCTLDGRVKTDDVSSSSSLIIFYAWSLAKCVRRRTVTVRKLCRNTRNGTTAPRR